MRAVCCAVATNGIAAAPPMVAMKSRRSMMLPSRVRETQRTGLDQHLEGAAALLMSASGVRRDKAALSSGCKSHPATAPAGSNRSSYGGNEVAEAFG